MANIKRLKEAGKGGKLGLSNMTHYGYTEEVKEAAKKARREDDKKAIEDGIRDLESDQGDSGDAAV